VVFICEYEIFVYDFILYFFNLLNMIDDCGFLNISRYRRAYWYCFTSDFIMMFR